MNESVVAEIRLEAWAECPPDMAMDDFVAYLTDLGNMVLVIDETNSRVKLCDYTAPQHPTFDEIKELYDGTTG